MNLLNDDYGHIPWSINAESMVNVGCRLCMATLKIPAHSYIESILF